MITDLLIYEVGEGGDLLLRGNDLVHVKGYENAPYLAMFGGNKWWANYLTKNKFQSKTEQVLYTTPLTSSGRVTIENAILSDLTFLNDIPGTKYSVSTKITNSNRLEISISINGNTFMYVWNPDTMFLTYQVI